MKVRVLSQQTNLSWHARGSVSVIVYLSWLNCIDDRGSCLGCLNGSIDNRGGRRDWKRVYKVWECDGACSPRHAPFAMIIQTVLTRALYGIYNVFWSSVVKTHEFTTPTNALLLLTTISASVYHMLLQFFTRLVKIN